MKKNLLYLWALVCSLTLFAACSSDDDDSDNKNNENCLLYTSPSPRDTR